jgi:hypothetical protein
MSKVSYYQDMAYCSKIVSQYENQYYTYHTDNESLTNNLKWKYIFKTAYNIYVVT